jgi:primosomal protein N' (replication factor Y)
MIPRFAQVALPLPLPAPYSYAIPDSLGDRVLPGARVVVPVRQRELVGIVVALTAEPPPRESREILAAPDPAPAILPDLLRTAGWMARYYGAPIGLALRAMLPSGLWGESRVVLRLIGGAPPGGLAGQLHDWLVGRGGTAPMGTAQRAFRRPLWEVADRLMRIGAVELEVIPAKTAPAGASIPWLALAGEPLTLVERARRFARSPKQRTLYEALESHGGSAELRHLRASLGISSAVVRSLVAGGLARVEEVEALRDPFAGDPGSPPPARLTADQAATLAGLGAQAPGTEALLFGVTGSGKTLVYLELVRAALAAGKGAILLVPEIALTPQTVGRVRGAFGDQVAVLHSALSDPERADAWRAIRRGDKPVVVGARSAIFAPVPTLGVIVIDEEHEASYKNGETPRYHAREVARVRARLTGARIVHGSATPSLETMERTREGVALYRLPTRIAARPMPPVEVVDLRHEPLVAGARGMAWSERLDQAIDAALARREQVLLLLNRRGFAAFLQCPSCGAVPGCPRCSISLTVHQRPDALRCHYCAHQESVPERCAECAHPVHRQLGVGTQQLERLLAERYPGARLARMDRDTTSARWSHHRILEAVGRGEVDILLGTQMIAKGIDFPNVTLVGVVDADTALHLPDFRAAERTFQLLAQVGGRAGRGPLGGRVLVQTRNPEHPALACAARHDAEQFLTLERATREAPAYPPHTALVNLVLSGEDAEAVAGHAAVVADWCQALIERRQ